MKGRRRIATGMVALFVGLTIAGCCGSRAGRPDPAVVLRQQSVVAVLYLQTAAEARALCYQAFNIARRILDDDLASGKPGKRAVVVDIDETVLSNAPMWAELIVSDTPPAEAMKRWAGAERAEPTAGSVEFLNYAVSKGADVFYVSNRKPEFFDVTMASLRKAGFPQVEPSHIILRGKTQDKESRRERIEKTHRVVLLMGDMLGDFCDVGLDKSPQERRKGVDRIKAEFGRRFVVLPNPAQGHWLNAVTGYRQRLTPEEAIKLRMAALEPYSPGAVK